MTYKSKKKKGQLKVDKKGKINASTSCICFSSSNRIPTKTKIR